MEKTIYIVSVIYIVLVLIILTIRMVNTYYYNKTEVPEINSADSNISTAKIADLTEKAKSYFKLDDFVVTYGEEDVYNNIFKHTNLKEKTIKIPKYNLISPGYELDYIFASLFIAYKQNIKDKSTNKFNWALNILPIIATFFFCLGLLLTAAIFLLNKLDYVKYIIQVDAMRMLSKFPVIQCIGISGFIVRISCIVYLNSFKTVLETAYEKEIILFVNQFCEGYKSDVASARVYATSINQCSMPMFRVSRKVSDLKYLGPFVFM